MNWGGFCLGFTLFPFFLFSYSIILLLLVYNLLVLGKILIQKEEEKLFHRIFWVFGLGGLASCLGNSLNYMLPQQSLGAYQILFFW